MKVYADNPLNRKLGRVGQPIPKVNKDTKRVLKRGIKIKTNLPYSKRRVTAIYLEIVKTEESRKLVFEFNEKIYTIDINKANLKII